MIVKLTKTDQIDYYYLHEPEQILWLMNRLEDLEDNVIALDTETAPILRIPNSSALDPHTAQVQMIQLMSLEWDAPVLIDVTLIGIPCAKPVIEYIDKHCLAIAFNAKFDIQQIRSSFGIFLKNVHCVQIAMFILAGATGFKAAKMRGFSYKSLCRDLFGVHLDKNEAVSNWSSKTKTLKQLEYAALDVGAYKSVGGHQSYLLESYQILKDLLFNVFEMQSIWDLEQENMVCVSDMEYVGMPINQHILYSLLDQTAEEVEDIKIDLAKELNLNILQKLVKDKGGFKRKHFLSNTTNKIFNSPKQFPALISQHLNCELTDLKGESLSQLLTELTDDSQIAFLKKVILYKQLVKLIDKDWDSLLNPVTKAVHPSYNVIGCSTGRMSSSGNKNKKFNAQALAKREVVIEIDESDYQYSQSIIK